MKKLFTLICVLSLVAFMSTVSLAQTGDVLVGVAAGNIDLDADIKTIPNGIAGGISAAGGFGVSGAAGFVINGEVSADVAAIGGGATDTDAYRIHNPQPGFDKSIGVGVRSDAIAQTGGLIDVDINSGFGGGLVGGAMFGAAGQGTLVGSALIQSPKYFNTTGLTVGIAGQYAVGGFHGDAEAGVLLFGSAGGDAEANIFMSGFSQSDSWRAVDWNSSGKTEAMGTNVATGTMVVASASDDDYDHMIAKGHADVDGCWTAAGMAKSITIQNAPGPGGAAAIAVGTYAANGGLGRRDLKTFNGTATGYTNTSVTTFWGMGGSINSAAAGMTVTTTANVPN